MTRRATTGLAVLGLLAGCSSLAHANLVQNGSFEVTDIYGQLTRNANVANWFTDGYNYIFNMSNVDTTGSVGQFGALTLWGPNNGSNNGFVASPDGGNFIAADGAFQVGPITQTINGLTVGHTYQVGFYWGAAQQSGFTGATTDKWTVSLGSEAYSTSIIDLPNHGFAGWFNQTFSYTATSTSEVLSFLATGTPDGVPPFALLDGVSMVDTTSSPDPGAETPEPGAAALMVAGLLSTGVLARKRARKGNCEAK